MITTSCNSQQAEKELDYDQTKKMVVDILQTEDGKKAIQDLILSSEMKEHLIIASDVVKQSINEALLSERGEKMWKSLFEDPSFAKQFTETMSDSQKDLLKQLMTDPEYQQHMMDILQNPELMNQILQLLKSQQFRSHIQTIISETINSPLFQSEMAEILLKMKDGESSGEKSSDSSEDSSGSSNK